MIARTGAYIANGGGFAPIVTFVLVMLAGVAAVGAGYAAHAALSVAGFDRPVVVGGVAGVGFFAWFWYAAATGSGLAALAAAAAGVVLAVIGVVWEATTSLLDALDVN
ncbi:hypothetical protein SAMN06269185_0004 [Natronoarchaeum philippinense]|uniref:Uncharacterized protein n=1 Tax=Natronoarchaeum philippinense TaxID=558529 RepID=A0A285N0P0_NATPI|nr:hypothetical protein [Natronoarchaeum philippinense]SNZ02367.1 hypothetical protein SAMN06269185_0004 [Natronoarchaeum philippinense]